MNWRRWYRVVNAAIALAMVVALLFVLALPSTVQAAKDSPIIHHASVQPTKVYPGDTMTVTAGVSDSSGIESVTADMGGIETISLSLIEGSIYHGTWQGQWLVHNTKARDYVTTIVATNSLGKNSSTDIVWRDPQTYERYLNFYGTEQTTTSTTWQDAHTITFTPNVTGDFLVLSSSTLQNDSTSDYTEVQVIYNSTVVNTRQFTPALTTEGCTFGTHEVISLTGDTSYTFKTQYRSGAGATARISDCRFNIFNISDYHDATEGSGSTTVESYTPTPENMATLTFTPATAGDYLIYASTEIAYNSTSESFYARLYYDTGAADWGEMCRQPTATGDYHQYYTMRMQNLSATPHTFYLQSMRQTGGSGTVSYRRARITAIRASDLGDIEYAETEAEQSTNSTTYQIVTSVNWDHATYENYYRFASNFAALSKTSKFAYACLYEDNSPTTERIMQPNATTDYIPLWGGLRRTIDATAHTHDMRFHSSSAAAYAYMKHSRLTVISIDTLNPFSDSGHDTYCSNFNSSGLNTVYIQGFYFEPSHSFHVAYYDNSGSKILSDGVLSDANGVVSSQCYFPTYQGTAAAGTWHAVIYDDDIVPPPETYNATDSDMFEQCTFTVTAEAIPEFPTIFAAIGVAGSCFAIYYFMRKRRLAHVKA